MSMNEMSELQVHALLKEIGPVVSSPPQGRGIKINQVWWKCKGFGEQRQRQKMGCNVRL
jgi:hypothetical protein